MPPFPRGARLAPERRAWLPRLEGSSASGLAPLSSGARAPRSCLVFSSVFQWTRVNRESEFGCFCDERRGQIEGHQAPLS